MRVVHRFTALVHEVIVALHFLQASQKTFQIALGAAYGNSAEYLDAEYGENQYPLSGPKTIESMKSPMSNVTDRIVRYKLASRRRRRHRSKGLWIPLRWLLTFSVLNHLFAEE